MQEANPQEVKVARLSLYLGNADRLERSTDDILDITRIEESIT